MTVIILYLLLFRISPSSRINKKVYSTKLADHNSCKIILAYSADVLINIL
jgi:hypothetical protein